MDQQKRHRYLEAMGIRTWQLRHAPAPALPDMGGTPPAEAMATGSDADAAIARMDWPELETAIRSCTRCELHRSRTHAVPGVGDRKADWMVIGEGPGAEEDKQGEPFVGRAGKLLDQMLLAIGLAREAVYITNIVKCRPPGNRDPKPDEAAACQGYLQRQIDLIRPRIILAVGRVAAHNLLQTDERIGALRGKRFEYAETGIPVVITYHPAYLLRSPGEKRKAWQDLLLARRLMYEQR